MTSVIVYKNTGEQMTTEMTRGRRQSDTYTCVWEEEDRSIADMYRGLVTRWRTTNNDRDDIVMIQQE